MQGHPSAQGADPVIIQPGSHLVSPLRRRMLEDMPMRGMRDATQRDRVIFTILADIAFRNKAAVYNLLLGVS
jgi:hypothetical protein